MSKNAKLEVRLRVNREYLEENIKVQDKEFTDLLEKAVDSYVPLGELVLNFWFYKHNINLEVRDYIFEKVFLRMNMTKAESYLPISSDIKVTSSALPVQALGEFAEHASKSLPARDSVIFQDYNKYFGEEKECESLPAYKLKEIAGFFAQLFPEQLCEIDKKEFPASLDIKYVK